MRIYIAAPYTKGDQVLNMRAAIDAAEALVAKGHTPFIPHLSAFWHLVAPHPVGFWYAYDLEWLSVCDAVLRLRGESIGADAEVITAKRMGKVVFTDIANTPDAAPGDVQGSLGL
jgi:hypothetical protein